MAKKHDGLPAELIQQQIEQILESPEFAGSRRLSAFLRFVCAAALEGRTEIDQSEIARKALGRAEDFSPVEDSSVRKIATMVRQRLEQYYSNRGARDPVEICLLARSYVPRFKLRENAEANGSSVSVSRRRRIAIWLTAGAAVVLLIAAAVAVAARGWRWRSEPAPAARQFVITVRKGDIGFTRTDAPPESLLLGPQIGATAVIVTRMRFSPRNEVDQAGIMIYSDVNNYVRFGRILVRRTFFEFSAEKDGRSNRNYSTAFTFDPSGQTGDHVWLAIRRNRREFTAYTSIDGRAWVRTGRTISLDLPERNARMAIYGFADFDGQVASTAVFDHLGVGPPVATWGEAPVPLPELDGWQVKSTCGAGTTYVSKPTALELSFSEGAKRCSWDLLHAMPSCEWSLTAVVDSLSWAGTYGGLVVRGDKRYMVVVRNDYQGGSIVGLMHPVSLFQKPDFPGSPALTMRLQCSQGMITAQAGPGFDNLEPLPLRVSAGEFGGNLLVGPRAGRSALRDDAIRTPVGFQSVAVDVLSLQKYR